MTRLDIRPLTPELIDAIAADASEDSILVAEALGCESVKSSLEYTASVTRHPEAVLLDGVPMAALGLYEPGVISARGIPWFVYTKAMLPHSRTFFKATKVVVNHWQQEYDVLSAFVLTSFTKSRRWVEWLGFREIQEVEMGLSRFTYYERRK